MIFLVDGDEEQVKVPRRKSDFLRVHECLRSCAAIASSPSELVFPKANGTMMRRDVNLEHTLRSALGRAGVVEGYRHVCRREGCGHVEAAANRDQRARIVSGILILHGSAHHTHRL